MTSVNEITTNIFAVETLANLDRPSELRLSGDETVQPQMIDFLEDYLATIKTVATTRNESTRAMHYLVLVQQAYEAADKVNAGSYPEEEGWSEQAEQDRLTLGEMLETLESIVHQRSQSTPGAPEDVFEWREPATYQERKTIARYLPNNGKILETVLSRVERAVATLSEQTSTLVEERDEAIREALRSGTPVVAIAKAAGLSRQAIYDIAKKRDND